MASIPQVPGAEQLLTQRRIVVGVDTHRDVHVAAVLTEVGEVLGDASFPGHAAGYEQLLAWAGRFGGAGRRRRHRFAWQGLVRTLREHGIVVIEVNVAGAENSSVRLRRYVRIH